MQKAYRYGISTGCAVVLALFAAVPENVWSSLPSVCVFRQALGLECFGCGMTRALSAVMHGHLEVALGLNEGVIVALGGLVAGLLHGVRR